MAVIRVGVVLLIGLVAGLVLGKVLNITLEVELLAGILVVLLLGYLMIEGFARFKNSLQKSEQVCPKCRKPIHRIHRSQFDRFLGVFIPNLRRYSCTDSSCGWNGLMIGKAHDHSHSQPVVLEHP